MKHWKPWTFLYDEPELYNKEIMELMNVSNANPFPVHFEEYAHMKHEAGPRRPTAVAHPE